MLGALEHRPGNVAERKGGEDYHNPKGGSFAFLAGYEAAFAACKLERHCGS
jgi:hypothetical protein